MLSSRAIATRRIWSALYSCGYVIRKVTWTREHLFYRTCVVRVIRDGQEYGTLFIGPTYGSVARQFERTFHPIPEDYE